MATPAEIAANFIAANLSLVIGTGIFIGKEPASPIDCLTVYDTGGRDELTSLEHGCKTMRRPSIQIRARNKSYQAGYSALQAAGEALKTARDYQYDGLILTAALRKTDIISIGKDTTGSSVFTLNFDLTIKVI